MQDGVMTYALNNTKGAPMGRFFMECKILRYALFREALMFP